MRPAPGNFRAIYLPRPRGGRHSGRRRAFTLIELVIVMLIMAILTAAATPAFVDSLLFHRVESAARRVKADLELARHTARLTSASQSITFTGRTYTLSPAVKSLDRPAEDYSVDLAASPYELSSVTADFNGSQSVSFDGYGTPSSGGEVLVSAKSHQCIVELDASNGEVTITSNHARARTASTSN